VVGKGAVGMGSVQVQVRLKDVLISETLIDCLLPVASKPDVAEGASNNNNNVTSTGTGTFVSRTLTTTEGEPVTTASPITSTADFVWYSDDIHLLSKLEIDATSIITISFTVVASDPKREQNTVKLASVTLS
jgi:hypothetical protein